MNGVKIEMYVLHNINVVLGWTIPSVHSMCRMEIQVRRIRLSTSRSEQKEDYIEIVSQQYQPTLAQSLQCQQWVCPCKKWGERWTVDLSQETGVNIQMGFLELHIVVYIVLHLAIRHGLMRLSQSVSTVSSISYRSKPEYYGCLFHMFW